MKSGDMGLPVGGENVWKSSRMREGAWVAQAPVPSRLRRPNETAVGSGSHTAAHGCQPTLAEGRDRVRSRGGRAEAQLPHQARAVEVGAALGDLAVDDSVQIAELELDLAVRRVDGAVRRHQRAVVRAASDALDRDPFLADDQGDDLDLGVRHGGGPVLEVLAISGPSVEIHVEGNARPLD